MATYDWVEIHGRWISGYGVIDELKSHLFLVHFSVLFSVIFE